MGIFCEILVRKPLTGTHRPGQAVTGLVKYAVDEPTECKDIVLVLKGKGKCSWTARERVNNEYRTVYYSGNEVYMDHCASLLDDKLRNSVTLQPATYEREFKFILPTNIPPSYKDHMSSITYRLKLIFVKRGTFMTNKKFYTEIPIQSYFEVEDTGNPVVFGVQKNLFRPLSKKKHVINLKAEIANTLIEPGDDIKLAYVVTNDTNVQIKTVKAELTYRMTHAADCGKQYTYSKTLSGYIGESPSVPTEAITNLYSIIKTSPDIYSIQNSKVVNRQYKVLVTVQLPVPYFNASTKIPISIYMKRNDEVGDRDDEPPSYWEVMSEDTG